jgi:hypothetical protein
MNSFNHLYFKSVIILEIGLDLLIWKVNEHIGDLWSEVITHQYLNVIIDEISYNVLVAWILSNDGKQKAITPLTVSLLIETVSFMHDIRRLSFIGYNRSLRNGIGKYRFLSSWDKVLRTSGTKRCALLREILLVSLPTHVLRSLILDHLFFEYGENLIDKLKCVRSL